MKKKRELKYADPLEGKPKKEFVPKTDPDADEYYRRLTVIDEGDLHNEGDFQIPLTGFFAELLVNAEQDHSIAEVERDLLRAQTELRVRKSPNLYDLPDKPNEGAIKAAVTSQPEMQEAELAVIRAKHKIGMMKAAMMKVDSRKRAIENRIKLLEQNYWAAPRR